MNFNKQNNKMVINNSFLLKTKSQAVGTDDLCSKSGECPKRSEKIKGDSNLENTRKFKKPCISKKIRDDSSVKLIHASPKAFCDLGTQRKCRNKTTNSSNEKSDMPCACENCALIGDSRKIPFVSEVIHYPRNTEEGDSDRERWHKTNLNEEEHAHCQHCTQLFERIKDLEERLKVQEERTVPKTEFKKIIARLVTYITANQTKHKISISQCKKTKEDKYREKCYESYTHPFHSPLLNTKDHPGSSTKELPRFCDKKTSPITINHPFWKRGEGILKPGIDIKNKIVLLIEDALKKFPKNVNKLGDKSKSFIEDTFSNAWQNARTVLETKTPIFIGKNVHRSDTSVRISYVNPRQWEESYSSLKTTVSDVNLSRTSNNLKDIYKELFTKMVYYYSQEKRQRLWNAVKKQCLIFGYDKVHRVIIHFPLNRVNNNLDDIQVEFTVDELGNLLTGK